MVNSYCKIPEQTKMFEAVFAEVVRFMGVPAEDFEVDISVVDKVEIRALNKENRNIDEVTDVLSFPNIDFKKPYKKDDYSFDIDYDSDRIMLGDIVICAERMAEQAEEYGHSQKRELAFLATHGLLHLFGFDHIVEEDRTQMRLAEESVLTSLNIRRE